MKVILKFVNQNDLSDSKEFHINLDTLGNVDADDLRIERLGYAQASMMSARTRRPYLFCGYDEPGTEFMTQVEAWTWKELVSDDYTGIATV